MVKIVLDSVRLDVATYAACNAEVLDRGPEAAESDIADARLPVLVTHATGLCKEAYEPLIQSLQDSLLGSFGTALTLDFRGHGSSDPLSPAMLQAVNADPNICWDWGAADANVVMSSDIAKEVFVSSASGMIGVGHSYGATALLQALLEGSCWPGLRGIALYEPILFTPGYSSKGGKALSEATRRRRQHFESVEVAVQRFSSRPPMSTWDMQALRRYVECGFKCVADGGVQIACNTEYEALMYTSHNTVLERCIANPSATTVPILLVVGKDSRHMGEGTQQMYAEFAKMLGCELQVLQGCGHFGPLERPGDIANAISKWVQSLPSVPHASSRVPDPQFSRL